MTKSYSIELAKSNRSGCKKCGEKIDKGQLRVGTHDESKADHVLSSWNHTKCFNLPRIYAAGAEKCTVLEFVETHLRDDTDEGVLQDPDKLAEVVALISEKPPRKAKEETGNDLIKELKREYAAMQNGEEDGKDSAEPDSKRAKMLDDYEKIHKRNIEQLKDELRWNYQVLKGKKDFLLAKVIDGRLNGRLAPCPGCFGKLKFNEETGVEKVTCSGHWDESLSMKIPCPLEFPAKDAPRWMPWYPEKPTDEEKEEMDRVYEAAKEGALGGGAAAADGKVDEDSDLGKLMEKAKGLGEIDVSDRDAKKASKKAICDFLVEDSTLDLPEKGLGLYVGQIIEENQEKTAPELVRLVAQHYGFAEAKEELKAKKTESAAFACAEPKNAPLMAALHEYAELNFKNGDKFKGAATNKVVAAIKDLPFEVTAENALKLGKAGKDKLPGVGKSSAENMHEFLTTGSFAKLDKLRSELQG